MITLPFIKKRKSKLSGADLFLIIGLSIVVAFALTYLGSPSFSAWIGSVGPELQEFAFEHGYSGAFVITLLSNTMIIIPIPYGSVLFLLGSVGLHPWLLTFITAMAAALGEVVAYGLGWGAGSLIKNKEYIKKFERIKDFISRKPRLTPLLIYLFGATPVPDDIIMIPLGLVKYNFWKAIIPDALGKFTMILIVVLSGRYSYTFFSQVLGPEGGFWASIIALVLTIVFIYFTIKVKWDKLIK